MILLLIFEYINTYRLLKPKLLENKDLYLTNINSKLALSPFGNKENQRIFIHKRKISFSGDRLLTLENDSIEIKLKKDKIVTFLRRPKNQGKKADPFGFKNKKRNVETTKETSKQMRPLKSIERPIIENVRTSKIETQKLIHKKTETDEDSPEEINKPDVQNIDMDSILTKVKHLLNEKKNYLVESDSKIEEDTIKYSNIEVFIHPLSDKYIKLKTEEKDCVTFYKDSFIFTPCVNVDNQIFKLENEEDILKTSKGFEDDTSDSISSRKHNPIRNTNNKMFSASKRQYTNELPYNQKKVDIWEEDEDEPSYKERNISKNELGLPNSKKVSENNIHNVKQVDVKDTNTLKYKPLPYNNTKSIKYDFSKANLSSPYNALFNKKPKMGEFKTSKEYVPPIIQEKTTVKSVKTKSIPEPENTFAKAGSTDDFLQKIKNSVSMPELDDIL